VVGVLNRSCGPITVLFAALMLVCGLPLRAHTQTTNVRRSNAPGRVAAFSTVATETPRNIVPLAATCPNQSGILNSISVPVSHPPDIQPLSLRVITFAPAPKGGVTFQLASGDPSVVTAGDIRQSFLPQVTIPEGQTQSNAFVVFGIRVGATSLNATSLTPGFPGFSTPIGAWDVNPGSNANLSKFLDANPRLNNCRVSNSPDLSTDPNVLAACGHPVMGTVADGVSQLLMRLASGLSGTACYDIVSSSPPDQGKISASVLDTQAVGSLNYGFSFYQAPDGYGATSDSRTVQVQFAFTPNLGNGNTTKFTAKLTVIRPPLMLIHGVWADSSSWEDKSWLRDPTQDYLVFKGDYGPTHDASFATNWPKVQGYIAKALIMARDQQGYAATQADVVAHSMGGILTRLYAASPKYLRPDNFNLGDIHRFVTLDTPHGGSSFANLVIALHTQKPTAIEASVHKLVGADAFVDNGAVCDLAESSPALVALASPTNLTAQVVTATGGPAASPTGGKFFEGKFGNGDFEKELTNCEQSSFFTCIKYTYDQTTVNAFRFRQANDAIVPLCSQQGGMGGTSCPAGGTVGINFPKLLHFGAEKYTVKVSGVTNTQAVATRVFALLDGPKSGFASSIPGLASKGTGASVTVPGIGAVADAKNYTSQCVTGTPPPLKHNVLLTGQRTNESVATEPTASAAAGDSRIQVMTPTEGQVFAPGDTVSATVSIAPALKASYVSLDVYGLLGVAGTGYTGSSYQASFTIPAGVAGPLELVPQITDTGNHTILGLTTTIAVRPTTPPLTLTLSQPNDVLTSVGETEQIYPTGTYAGSIVRDLRSSASGTTYKSSNTKVITVDPEGNVKAAGFGTAVVTVANSGVQAFATFTVEDPDHPLAPQDLSSQLMMTRLGFRVDRNTGFFSQSVQWTNTLPVPVIGPLYFVVTGLPAGVTLIGAGTTQNIGPAGSPYFSLNLPDGITVQPGATISQVLQFLNPSRTRIDYTAKVFRTLASP
jgi:pimeloyl-ACP methyl ester carboxylesterase